MDVCAGTLISKNVRLVRPVGQGAMGTVWIAEHLTLETQVAVKLIAPELTTQSPEVVLARFVQEASLAAKIKSPHVVQTFDRGVHGGDTPYIVMELLEGESLQDRLDRRRRLPLIEVERIVTHVCRALSKAHELGVVHRDIKPDNIFLTPGDDGPFCKVLDFGIAKQTQLPGLGGITNPGTMVGTPEYMSPEQALNAKDVDAYADLWGMAVTAYHCLTGELPFTAEALGTLCVKLLDGRFKPPSELHLELPAGMDLWMARALARQPSDRFACAKELAHSFIAVARSANGEVWQSADTASGKPLPGKPWPDRSSEPRSSTTVQNGQTPTVPSAQLPPMPTTRVTKRSTTTTLDGSTASRERPGRTRWPMVALGAALSLGAALGAAWSLGSLWPLGDGIGSRQLTPTHPQAGSDPPVGSSSAAATAPASSATGTANSEGAAAPPLTAGSSPESAPAASVTTASPPSTSAVPSTSPSSGASAKMGDAARPQPFDSAGAGTSKPALPKPVAPRRSAPKPSTSPNKKKKRYDHGF